VLDVDQGDPLAVAAHAPPAALCPTRRDGGAHLWYWDASADRPNSRWQWRECAGDIRSSRGYVILWPHSVENLVSSTAMDIWGHDVALDWEMASFRLWGPSGLHLEGKAPQVIPPPPGAKRGLKRGEEGRRVVDLESEARNLELFRQVLFSLPADDYQTWIDAGLALEGSARRGAVADGAALALWREWSRTSPKYKANECSAKWRTFTGAASNPLTMATLLQRRLV